MGVTPRNKRVALEISCKRERGNGSSALAAGAAAGSTFTAGWNRTQTSGSPKNFTDLTTAYQWGDIVGIPQSITGTPKFLTCEISLLEFGIKVTELLLIPGVLLMWFPIDLKHSKNQLAIACAYR